MINYIYQRRSITTLQFLLILVVLITSLKLHGQVQNPLLEKEEFKYSTELEQLIPHKKEIYTLDAQQQMIESDVFYWHEASNRYNNTLKVEQTYTEDGLLSTKTFLNLNETITTNRTWEYSYFESGCTDSLVFINYDEVSKEHEKWVTHYNAEKCQQIDLLQQYIWIEAEQIWRKILSWEYEHTLENTVITIFRTLEGLTDQVGSIIYTLDDRGNIIKSWTNYIDYAAEIESTYAYNDRNDQTYSSFSIKTYHSDETLDLVTEEFHTHTYNGDQILSIETIQQHYDNSIIYCEINIIEEYVYHCDELLKEIITYEAGIVTKKEKYVYENGIDCGTSLDNTNVYPNPVKNYLYVESDLLEHPNSNIQLYDRSGKLINTFEVKERRDAYEIPMFDLPIDIYLLQIEGGENRITKKVLKH